MVGCKELFFACCFKGAVPPPDPNSVAGDPINYERLRVQYGSTSSEDSSVSADSTQLSDTTLLEYAKDKDVKGATEWLFILDDGNKPKNDAKMIYAAPQDKVEEPECAICLEPETPDLPFAQIGTHEEYIAAFTRNQKQTHCHKMHTECFEDLKTYKRHRRQDLRGRRGLACPMCRMILNDEEGWEIVCGKSYPVLPPDANAPTPPPESPQGSSPLHIAAEHQDIPMLKLFISRCTKINPDSWSPGLLKGLGEALTGPGSPLISAAEKNHLDVLVLLLDAARTAKCSEDPWRWDTPLHIAVNMNNLTLVKAVLGQFHRNKDNISFIQNPYSVVTFTELGYLLLVAVRNSSEDIAAMLIDAGADVDFQDEDEGGSSGLHEAVARLLPNTVGRLLDAKANVDLKNSEGDTPLGMALKYSGKNPEDENHTKRLEIVKMLLHHRQTIDAKLSKKRSLVEQFGEETATKMKSSLDQHFRKFIYLDFKVVKHRGAEVDKPCGIEASRAGDPGNFRDETWRTPRRIYGHV